MLQTYRKLLDLLTPREKKRFYLLFAMMIAAGLVEMLTVAAMLPFLTIVARPEVIETNATLAYIYNFFGFTSPKQFLAATGFAVFLVVFFGLLFVTYERYAIYRFTAMRSATIGKRMLKGYLRQPYAWFLNQHSAGLESSILTEVGEVVNRSMLPAMKLLAQAVVAFFLVALLVVADPMVAFTAGVLVGGSYALIYTLIGKRISRMGVRRKAAVREKYKIMGEAIGGVKDVKLLGLEDVFVDRYERSAIKLAKSVAGVSVASELPRNALRAITLGGILFFVVAMLVWGDGDLTTIVPILGLYAFAGMRLLPALQQIYMSLTHMRYSRPVLDKFHADMKANARRVEDVQPPADTPPLRLHERLDLVDVHYAYPNAERGALNGFDLSIDARTSVGIVGGTGAGKTTAVDVILGLLRPQQGKLVVDGAEVTDARVRGWQKSIGYVPQHIFLIDDSVVANIAFGIAPGKVDMAAIERAARIAELHDFITEDLPQGYQTMLGERGVRLSGGQRQRVGIARALYHDPDVLVLDEATSALDNLTERAVMDAVQNLGREKTIVMIAHRLSTVRDCDRIVLLEQGRVVAEGTYDALVETNDEFRKLVAGGRG